MSTQVNTNLYERAAEQIDRWEGTVMCELLEWDLEINDLQQLAKHVAEAEALESVEEFHNYDAL